MAHTDRDSFRRFPQKGRASTQMSVSTLTDAALIAFEIEHERNRLREELQRLQSAQNDTQRSIEILDFMASRMDKDPLVNPQNTDDALMNGHHTTTLSNHVPYVHNGGNMTKMNGHAPSKHAQQSHPQMNSSNSEMFLNLEYLPANTLIRLANKQTKRVSELQIGDKVISLCINAYPQSSQKRDSFLPKPSKRPSQIAREQQSAVPSSQSRQSLGNGISRTKSMHNSQRSLSGIPQRVRAKTHAIAAIPFMLPPPERPNDEDEDFSSSSTAQMAQRYHSKKKDSFPRKSMPFMPAHTTSYEDDTFAEDHFNDQHRYTSPNLIAQSVTAAVSESLIYANNNKPRSRSIASPLMSHGNGYPMATLRDNSSAEQEDEDKSPSPPAANREEALRRMQQARSSASFTQIPGPRPVRQGRSHHARVSHHHQGRQQQHRMHAPMHKARVPSQPVPMSTLRAAKSQHNSPNARNGHNHNRYLENNIVPLSRSQNNSPRFAAHSASNQPPMQQQQQRMPERSKQTTHRTNSKRARFSTNDAAHRGRNDDMFKQKMREKIQRKKNNSNYLESVHVIQIIPTKIYKLIEIITDNDFRIRCSPTHMFWICGKGWGCFDSKSRMSMEKQIALRQQKTKHENGKHVKLAQILHELKKGEQLLTVGGHKYRIAEIKLMEKPKGVSAYSIIVNKNHCFFANDLLVKNAIS